MTFDLASTPTSHVFTVATKGFLVLWIWSG